MNFILMQVSPEAVAEAIRAADVISSKNDRWMFIFTLIVFAICVFWSIRYMVNSIEKLQSKNDTLTSTFNEQILKMWNVQNEIHSQFSIKLDRNTVSLEQNTAALTQSASIISDLRRKTDSLTAALNRHQPATS